MATIKIWHYTGMDRATLEAMKRDIEAEIARTSKRNETAHGNTSISATVDLAALGEKLQAVNYALRRCGNA